MLFFNSRDQLNSSLKNQIEEKKEIRRTLKEEDSALVYFYSCFLSKILFFSLIVLRQKEIRNTR